MIYYLSHDQHIVTFLLALSNFQISLCLTEKFGVQIAYHFIAFLSYIFHMYFSY